jgi:hypothetical protein
MRIIILSIIALLINYAANGQGKPPIGGTATDTAWIRGSLQVDKQLRFGNYPNGVLGTDANGKVVVVPYASALNLKTIDTPYRYSVSGNELYMTKSYSTAVQGITYINDSNAILVYRDDSTNGHVSNNAVLYYMRLINNVWQAPALLYDSPYDDRYGQFYKSITGDTLISQIRRVNLSPFGEVDIVNAYSTNGGATISTYQTITSAPAGYIPYGIVPAEGKYYQLFVRGDTIRLYRSDNGLTNWTFVSTVSQAVGALEPSLVYTGSNRFIVLARTLTGKNNLREFVSTNLGSSFSFLGYAPFGNVQPSMAYDAKRNLVIAISTQRLNASFYANVSNWEDYVNVWVGKPSEIATDTSKWHPIAYLHRPVPNAKAFLGAGQLNVRNDSTMLLFITDAFQCDTGVIGDFCDKTSSWKATITYSDKNLSNMGNISGYVWRDSMGNFSVRNFPQAITINEADSNAIFIHDKPLVFQNNSFNPTQRGLYFIGADNNIKTTIYKDGRIISSEDAEFGNVSLSGSISTGNPVHIASSPNVRFGGTRDTLGYKQWPVEIGGAPYYLPLSVNGGDFIMGNGSGANSYLPKYGSDGRTLEISNYRSLSGISYITTPTVIQGFLNCQFLQSPLQRFLSSTTDATNFEIRLRGTESGGNTGNNLSLDAYNDAGTFLYTGLSVERSTGNVSTYKALLAGSYVKATGVILGYREITASTTITADDYTLNVTANSFTQALPTLTTTNIFVFKNTGAGTLTLDPTGTIDGAATADVPAGEVVQIQSTGSGGNYIIIKD